jgi:hypothetical protein
MRNKKEENFFSECAEIGAMQLLSGAYCAVGENRVMVAAARAAKAIEKEYKPSPDKSPKAKSSSKTAPRSNTK